MCWFEVSSGVDPTDTRPKSSVVCPSHYDLGQSEYSLDYLNGQPGNTIGKNWGTTTADEAYYKGNHSICANEGMRLPTIFETQAPSTALGIPTTSPITAIFAEKWGIPSMGQRSVTATTFYDKSTPTFNSFITWQEDVADSVLFSDVANIRCVLQ